MRVIRSDALSKRPDRHRVYERGNRYKEHRFIHFERFLDLRTLKMLFKIYGTRYTPEADYC